MGTDISALRAQVLANVQAMKAAIPSGGSNNVKISMDKTFEFPDGTVTEGPFDCIVVGYRYMNAFYTKPYRPGEVSSPVCWAIGEDAAKLEPHEAVKKPQSDACETCPKNEWPEGGGGKPCRNMVKLAIVAPDATEANQIAIVRVAPTGLSGPHGFLKYLKVVLGKGLHPMMVTTQIGFRKDKDYPCLAFAPGNEHPRFEAIAGLLGRANELLNQSYEIFED
jgi:hypothetical protein